MSVCGDVAEYKIGTGKAVYDAAREAQKIAAVQELAHSEFNKEAVKEIFSQLMSVSRRYQYSLLSAHGMGMDTGFTEVETIGKKNKKIVFQGVEALTAMPPRSYYFGEGRGFFHHVPEFEDTMCEVEEGRADYAVLPIENSTAGFVINNYDLLLKYKNYIVGEVYVPVAHMLLGVPGAELSDIRTVYSHAQALAQSADFLSAHKDWKQIAVLNTAVAAKKVMEEKDPSQAAVASRTAGELYGMEILAEEINNVKGNTTRFLILGKEPVYAKTPERSAWLLRSRTRAVPYTTSLEILFLTMSI